MAEPGRPAPGPWPHTPDPQPLTMDRDHNTPLDLGLPVEQFLAEYWQQKPLVARGAMAGWRSPISADELAGLACEREVESRLVSGPDAHDDWNLELGPFEEARFSDLPESGWSLLVQDVDKLVPAVEALLDRFRFLPSWRIDDVMVSYAAPGGSVGAHWDHYDVFLIQAEGRRRWEIDTAPSPSLACRPDQELKLLQRFEPDEAWTLEPGDVLYLPPGVPHHGVALDACLTFSVGMRAPSHAEMFVDYAGNRAERLPEERRFADPGRTPADHPARIHNRDIEQAIGIIRELARCPDDELAEWFGRFVTRYRLGTEPPEQGLSRDEVRRLLEGDTMLEADPWTRWAFFEDEDGAVLFVNGESFRTHRKLALLLSQAPVRTGDLPRDEHTLELVERLLGLGFLRKNA